MSNRVSYNSYSSQKRNSFTARSPVVTRLLKGDPQQSLLEIHPGKTWSTVLEWVDYDRVMAENLNIMMLERIFSKENAKSFDVGETVHYFWYEYKNKPRIYISKSNGKIVAPKYGKMESYSALMMLKILNKWGLVIGFKRVQKRRTWNIGF
jgi:hypothetical protein